MKSVAKAEVRYELKAVKALRGTEARSIAKWERQGWELVAQDAALMHTTLNFRRARKQLSGRQLALAGVVAAAVAAAAAAGVGAALQGAGTRDVAVPGTPSPEAAAPRTTSGSRDTALDRPPAPPSLRAREQGSGSLCANQTCTFGQTARFTATSGAGPSRLIEITVAPPAPYAPTLEVEGAQAENVSFAITLKNLSSSGTWDPLILTEVESAGLDGRQIFVDCLDCIDVLPGQSVLVRDTWSLQNASDTELTLRIDGLAGYPITWSSR